MTGLTVDPHVPSLANSKLRLERARELIAEIRAIESAIPYDSAEVVGEPEPPRQVAHGRWEHYSPTIQLPDLAKADDRCALLIGEAVYNLRAALDYVVSDLAAFNGIEDSDKTQFPINETESKWVLGARKYMDGLTSEQCGVIEKLQPFRAVGNQWLLDLQRLSNVDKHRRLHVVMSQHDGFTKIEQRGDQIVIEMQFRPQLAFDDETPIVSCLEELATQVEVTLLRFEGAPTASVSAA